MKLPGGGGRGSRRQGGRTTQSSPAVTSSGRPSVSRPRASSVTSAMRVAEARGSCQVSSACSRSPLAAQPSSTFWCVGGGWGQEARENGGVGQAYFEGRRGRGGVDQVSTPCSRSARPGVAIYLHSHTRRAMPMHTACRNTCHACPMLPTKTLPHLHCGGEAHQALVVGLEDGVGVGRRRGGCAHRKGGGWPVVVWGGVGVGRAAVCTAGGCRR